MILALAMAVGAAQSASYDDYNPVDDNLGRLCLALIVFAEARSESELGQAAVARVVINRSLQSDLRQGFCEVIQSPSQFESMARWEPPRRPWEIDQVAWEKALEISDKVLADQVDLGPCIDADHFHTTKSSPDWAENMPVVCIVDNHVFRKSK